MNVKCDYHQLGKSGLRVSVPILGCMSFGTPKWAPWVLPEEKGMAMLKAAWDLGINTFDTANIYSNGVSESVIGQFLTKYNIPRENAVILTKIALLVSPDPSVLAAFVPSLANTRDYVNQSGLSRSAIFNQVDASLRRLQTTYIDLLQIHVSDPTTPLEETMKALHDLVVAGKVRYIGASNLKAWQLAEMNHIAEIKGWTQFTSIQLEHSLLYRPEEREMFPYCKFKGIGILAYSPLMDGYLARPLGADTVRTQYNVGRIFEKKRRESDNDIIRRVEELSKKHSLKMCQVALEWSSLMVSSPIVGANSPERLQDCIVSRKALSDEDIKYLEAPYEFQPHRF